MSVNASQSNHIPGKINQIVRFILPIFVAGILWEALSSLQLIAIETLPPPSKIILRIWQLTWEEGMLWRHLSHSLYRLGIGYILAVSLGILFGTLLTVNRVLGYLFSPVLSLLISVPTVAWVPVLLVTMGLGDRTVITAIFLGGFFPIVYNTMRGIEMVKPQLINAARIMGTGGFKLLTAVYIPAGSVSIIAGLRLGLGYCWYALVGGEMLSALIEWGLGKMIYQARYWNDTTAMIVGLTFIGMTSFLMDRTMLKWLEDNTVRRWGMIKET